MKLLYVAGKYCDSRGEWYQHLNIELAKRVARHFWYKGFAVICPHANTAFMGDSQKSNWDMWIKGDLEILKRCDGIVLLPNYQDSPGAMVEYRFALETKKDVYHATWLGSDLYCEETEDWIG